MKIFLSHSREFDYQKNLYQPLQASALYKKHSFFFPHEKKKAEHTREVIKNSDLILAEVSYPSTGQGIELGWADAAKIPILCISKEGAGVSGSLKYITSNFLIYLNSQDLISQLSKKLNQSV